MHRAGLDVMKTGGRKLGLCSQRLSQRLCKWIRTWWFGFIFISIPQCTRRIGLCDEHWGKKARVTFTATLSEVAQMWVWCDSFICEVWLILMCAIRGIYVSDVRQARLMGHDSSMCLRWLCIRIWDLTRLLWTKVTRVYVHETWLVSDTIHMCD